MTNPAQVHNQEQESSLRELSIIDALASLQLLLLVTNSQLPPLQAPVVHSTLMAAYVKSRPP